MSNNLGREKIWNPDIWAEIDKAVLEEVGRIRIAQKVFPAVKPADPQFVPADKLNLREKTLTIAEGITKPLIEISVEFALTKAQVDSESTLKTGRTLARMAAKSIAVAEDMLIFQGSHVVLTDDVKVNGKESADKGLLGVATKVITVAPLSEQTHEAHDETYGEGTFGKVAKGISELINAAQPGPYALILAYKIYADTYRPLPQTLVTTADRITPLVQRGFYGTGTLPAKTGLLVSVGGEPTTIYLAQDAVTAFTHQDEQGHYRFRVFERMQFVARDLNAFIKLQFGSTGEREAHSASSK